MFALVTRLKDLVSVYQKELVIGAVVFVLAGASGYGYLEYNSYRIRQAHKAYGDCLRYVNAPVGGKSKSFDFDAITFSTEAEKWEKVERVFDENYKNYKGTTLAGLFLLQKSDALRFQGKLDEAIKVLEEGISLLPNRELGLAYQVKRALMQLDSADKATAEKGLAALKVLALQEKSAVREQALYRLGEYYWVKKDFATAKGYLEKVVAQKPTPNELVEFNPSQWVELSLQKLALITPQQ